MTSQISLSFAGANRLVTMGSYPVLLINKRFLSRFTNDFKDIKPNPVIIKFLIFHVKIFIIMVIIELFWPF